MVAGGGGLAASAAGAVAARVCKRWASRAEAMEALDLFGR